MDADKLAMLSDLAEIQSLKSHYCATVDILTSERERGIADLHRIFDPAARGDYGSGPADSFEAVLAFLISAIADNSGGLWHSLHTPRIVVEGDRATGDWTVLVRSRAKESGEVSTIYGRYSDEFTRTRDGWRISFIRFVNND